MAHKFNTGRYYSHDIGPYAYQWDGNTSLPQNAPRADSLAGAGCGGCPLAGLADVEPLKAAVALASAAHAYKASGGSLVAAAAFGLLGVFAPVVAGAALVYDVTQTGGFAKRSDKALAARIFKGRGSAGGGEEG